MSGMTLWEQILDFFMRLLRGRIDGASITARSKVKSLEYKAKAGVSRKFNQAIDGTVSKAKGKAKTVAARRAPAASESPVDSEEPEK